MRFSHFLSLAMALEAQAVLVLPKISSQDVKISSIVSGSAPWGAPAPVDKFSVHLHCASCPVAVGNTVDGQPQHWIEDAPINLLLEMTHRDGQILLNNVPIFPPSPAALGRPVMAKQVVPPSHPWTESEPIYSGPISVAVSVQMHSGRSIETMPSGEHVSSRQLTIDVLGVNDKVVHLESVNLRFDATTLDLLHIGVRPASPSNEECASIMCRFSELVRQKFEVAKALASSQFHRVKSACKGKHGAHQTTSTAFPPVKGGIAKYRGKFDKDGNFLGFGEGAHSKDMHHGSRCSRFAHAALHAVRAFIMPLMLGLASGMALGAIFMIVSQIVMFAYNLVRYGGQGYQPVEVVVIEEEEADEKDAMLPRYEDAVGSNVVLDEKN